MRQQIWNMNEQLVLLHLALVNIIPGYTIACPRFTLVGRPVVSIAPSIVILYNNSLLASNISKKTLHGLIRSQAKKNEWSLSCTILCISMQVGTQLTKFQMTLPSVNKTTVG